MNQRILLVAALLLSLAASAGAAPSTGREEHERDFHKVVPLPPGRKLSIEHSNGSIRVRTHREARAVIDAAIRVSSSDEEGAERFANEIAIDVTETAQGVSIRTRYPEKQWHFIGKGHISYSVDYDIVLPESAPLETRNRFGSVEVTGLKAAAGIKNTNGSITFRGGQGAQRLENAFGSIELTGNVGDATLANSNGSITVSALEGALDASNRFGKVTATRISGKATIVNSNGSVSLTDSSGDADLTNSFGSVSVKNLGGALKVKNSNGTIEATEIVGDADLNTSFGAIQFSDIKGRVSCTGSNSRVTGVKVTESVTVRNSFGAVEITDAAGVEIENANGRVTTKDIRGGALLTTSFAALDAYGVRGNLTAVNSNGAIRAFSVKGSVSARTSFGPVKVEGAGGRVEISNQNGSAEVSGLKASGCQPITVKTSFAPIRISVPEGASYAVSARTSFGKISSEMPLNVTGSISSESLSGKLGAGGCEMTLTNSNGSIDLSRDQAAKEK